MWNITIFNKRQLYEFRRSYENAVSSIGGIDAVVFVYATKPNESHKKNQFYECKSERRHLVAHYKKAILFSYSFSINELFMRNISKSLMTVRDKKGEDRQQ